MARQNNVVGGGCLSVLGLPFLLGGLFVLSLAWGDVALYRESETWTPTPVTLDSIDLRVHRGSKSTSYSLQCRYLYEFGDRRRSGTRVFAMEMNADARRAYKQLEACRARGERWTALVDPRDPDRAVLLRELSPPALAMIPFGLTFAVVGLGLMAGGLWSVLRGRGTAALRERYPDRPWYWNPAWRTFELSAGTGFVLFAAWGSALLSGLFVGTFVLLLWSDANAPAFVRLLMAFFALLPLALLGAAVYLTGQLIKYGVPALRLDQLPIVPGSELSGTVIVSAPVAPEAGILFTLACMKTVRHGKNTSTTELAKATATVPGSAAWVSGERTAIPFVLTVPAGAPPRSEDDEVSWRLEVAAATPGIDFGATFGDLPVFQVADPSLVERSSSSARGQRSAD